MRWLGYLSQSAERNHLCRLVEAAQHPYRLWAWVTAVVLVTTAVAKLAGILLKSPLLRGEEPLTGLSLPLATAVIAAGELGLACLLSRPGAVLSGAALTFVFAVGALGYRRLILSPEAPCPCLGGISQWLPRLAVYEQNLLLMVLLWLLLTAGGVLLHQRGLAAASGDT